MINRLFIIEYNLFTMVYNFLPYVNIKKIYKKKTCR